MIKIDTININGNKQRCVNLYHTVGIGAGAKNRKIDILLIQCLFFYLYFDKDAKLIGTPLYTPGHAVTKNFLPTGIWDLLTIQTIGYFQIRHRQHLLSVDGAIHPAKYEGRVIKDTNKPLMTITYLHLLAKRQELRSGDGDYVERIKGLVAYFYTAGVAGSMIKEKLEINREK